jgi:AMP-polyphosphate phosphotransferase
MGRLGELDLSLKLSKEEAERLDAGGKRLAGLRLALGAKLPGYALGPPVCVLFEGWGRVRKGRSEQATRGSADMRHVRVAQFAAPTPDEARHHYLFFLHISEEEQLRRFEQRRDDPLKTWKLTPADWENRRKRSHYLEAIEDMLACTDHDPSPWHLVEAESKKYARGKVVETVITHRARDARPADRAAGIRH